MRIALIAAQGQLTSAPGHDVQSAQPMSLARALAGHGHRVTLYTRREPPTARGPPSWDAEYQWSTSPSARPGRCRPKRRRSTCRTSRATCRTAGGCRQPDVVHAFSWTSGLAAIGAVRSTELPVLQTFESLGSAERRQLESPTSRPAGSSSRPPSAVLLLACWPARLTRLTNCPAGGTQVRDPRSSRRDRHRSVQPGGRQGRARQQARGWSRCPWPARRGAWRPSFVR